MADSRTALIMCDFQGGIIKHVLGSKHAGAREAVLARAAEALAGARGAGLEVVHIRVATPPANEAGDSFSRNKVFSGLVTSGAFREGQESTAIVPELAPVDGEKVFTKCRFGAFSTTALHGYLEEKGVTSIVLAGLSTSGVILSTVRDAADKDYVITVLEDACGDANDDVHACLTGQVFPGQAEVTRVSAFLTGLQP